MTIDDTLLRWVAGVLEPADEDAFEARLFDEPELARAAARFLDVRDALRAMAAEGPIVPVVHAHELRALAARARVTEHHPVNGRIDSHIVDEDFIAAHVPIARASHSGGVHVLFCTPEGAPYFRVNEAPFDPATGEVLVLCKRHVAIATGTLVVRVVDDAERVLGEVAIENHVTRA